MIKYIIDFPKQLREAVLLTQKASLNPRTEPVQNIVISGLGGSGFLADCLFDLTVDNIAVPIIANKGYTLPAFCDEKTLLILVSYSGNTEETVSCFNEAIRRRMKPVCVCSGGQLKELALANGMSFLPMPSGFPPRASLAFGAAYLFFVLNQYGLFAFHLEKEFTRLASFLESNQQQMQASAIAMAAPFKNKVLIAYVEDKIDGVGLRLKQQINENSKAYCWYNVVPELNHNELVGWKQTHHAIGSLFLRTSFENERNKHRFDFLSPFVNKYVDAVHEVHAAGDDFFEQYFYLIHWCDWLSYYLALEQEQDSVEVRAIDSLKAYLSNIN